MKQYIVISVYFSGEHYVESEKDGAYDDLVDAVKCLHQNDSTMIVDCKNAIVHELDDSIVTRLLRQEYPEYYPDILAGWEPQE